MSKNFNKATNEEKVKVQKIIEQINVCINWYIIQTTLNMFATEPFIIKIPFSGIDTTLIKRYLTYFRNYYLKYGWKIDLDSHDDKDNYDFQIIETRTFDENFDFSNLIKNLAEPYNSLENKVRIDLRQYAIEALNIFRQIQNDRINYTWNIVDSIENMNTYLRNSDSKVHSIAFNYSLEKIGTRRYLDKVYYFARYLAEEFENHGWHIKATISDPDNEFYSSDHIRFEAFPIIDQQNCEATFTKIILNWPEYQEKLNDETYFQLLMKFHNEWLSSNESVEIRRAVNVPKRLKERIEAEFQKQKYTGYALEDWPNSLMVCLHY